MLALSRIKCHHLRPSSNRNFQLRCRKLAHEVNQPLSAIALNSQTALPFLTKTPPNIEEARAALESIASDNAPPGSLSIEKPSVATAPKYNITRVDPASRSRTSDAKQAVGHQRLAADHGDSNFIGDAMNPIAKLRPSRPAIGRSAAMAALLFGTILAPSAHGQSRDDAKSLLRTMSTYIASQNNISIAYDSDIEVTTADLQKLQLTSSGQLDISRPDKVHASRIGGYTDVEFVLDRRAFSSYGKYLNSFAQSQFAVSIEQLVDRLRGAYFVEAPASDFLLSNIYDKLIEDVIDAKHVGLGVIDGIECEHLAFRNPDVDWQVWIEVGARPIPRKYVMTSKVVSGGPQYTLRITDWKVDGTVAADGRHRMSVRD
jgi:hypothetical protein